MTEESVSPSPAPSLAAAPPGKTAPGLDPWEQPIEQIGAAPPHPLSYWRIGAAVVVLAVLLVLSIFWKWPVAGSSWLSWSPSTSPRVLSSSQAGDSILYIQGAGDWRQVVVQQAGAANWLLVSGDDTTAAAAALADDGAAVAYRSAIPGQAITLVDLGGNRRTAIPASAIAAAGQAIQVGPLAHCPWTPLSWSPDGQRIAFFACTEADGEGSYVAVADVAYPVQAPAILSDTLLAAPGERQVLWSGNDRVVIVNPPNAGVPERTEHAVP